jgi:hypothetical protein
MYTFAFSEALPDPDSVNPAQHFVTQLGYADQSDAAMWERDLDPRRQNPDPINAVTGLPDEL